MEVAEALPCHAHSQVQADKASPPERVRTTGRQHGLRPERSHCHVVRAWGRCCGCCRHRYTHTHISAAQAVHDTIPRVHANHDSRKSVPTHSTQSNITLRTPPHTFPSSPNILQDCKLQGKRRQLEGAARGPVRGHLHGIMALTLRRGVAACCPDAGPGRRCPD